MGEDVTTEKITISVGEEGSTSGVLTLPGGQWQKTGVIVAHGAGNDMNAALLEAYAEDLAKAGYPVLRFNFLYSDRGRKSPDKRETLFAAWQAAYGFFRESMGPRIESVVAAGKSMGGRIAAEMTAEKALAADRLIFLGYPLHPGNDKEKLRDGSLYLIRRPMLFFAGTRDPLCDLLKLNPVLKRLEAPWELFIVEGGDHSFYLPKSQRTGDREVYGRIAAKSIEWLSRA